MDLITEELKKTLPSFYATEQLTAEDITVRVRLYDLFSKWAWYITEYDASTNQAFGIVKGHCVEAGYFSITELQDMGPRIEIDLSFEPISLADLRKQLK